MNDIEKRIAALLAEYLENSGNTELAAHGEITGATNLVSDFTMDSFQVMEFLMELEESYDIMIDVSRLSNIHTVSDLATIVSELTANS
jgi:acyl carrier protein